MSLGTRLRAMMQHEVSAADIDGLLRGTGQLESLRQGINDARLVGETTHPGSPWETYRDMGRGLLFFWVAQAYIAIARSLKEADDAYDPGTRDYMPHVSHDQALALLRKAGDYLAEASAALADPSYDTGVALPIPLDPRIEAEGRCPVVHLKGMLQGTKYLDDYAQVALDEYVSAAASPDAPREVKAAAQKLRGELAAARSRLAMAEGAVSPILAGQDVDQETHEGAEDNLWQTLATYVRLGQVIALPSLLASAPVPDQTRRQRVGHTPPPPPRPTGPQRIDRRERWRLTDGVARQRLVAEGRADWAEDELDELWENKGWTLSADEQRFLDEVEALQHNGAVRATSYMAECPFDPVWTATRPVTIMGQQIPMGGQLAYNHHHGKGEVVTSFRSAPDFEECQDD